MTGSSEQLLPQRAQYVANGIAVGVVAVNPDPARPAVRLVLRNLAGSGAGPAERQVTARPGEVAAATERSGTDRLTTDRPAPDRPGMDRLAPDQPAPDRPGTADA